MLFFVNAKVIMPLTPVDPVLVLGRLLSKFTSKDEKPWGATLGVGRRLGRDHHGQRADHETSQATHGHQLTAPIQGHH